MLHATTSVKPTPEFNVLVDFDIEDLCKNRCISSPSVIVLHMLTSGLENRQASASVAARFSKLERWHNDCAPSK
jgi:hypothetical protein